MTLSAMTGMSQAIRLEMQRHAPTLQDMPTPVLLDYVLIVSAFLLDVKDELAKRGEGEPE